MALNLAYGIALAIALWFLSTTELTFINGNVAALILASGAITALAFSMLARREGVVSNESQELAAAAERYLRTLSQEERERLNNESIELTGAGLGIKARGHRLVSDNLSLLLLYCTFAAFMYYHHTTNMEMLARVLEATVENTYVLSLSQAERENLRLTMPESLRKKLRARASEP